MKKKLTLTMLALAFTARIAQAAEPTAFELIREGNEYVGKDAKDKIVQIRSEKSIGSLIPNIWYIVYYDVDATFKATEVKFGGGKKLKVTRPMRMLEPVTGGDKKLDREKFKIDSDKAVEIASGEPILKPVTLKASKLTLEKHDEGPVWKVELWAAKLKNPNDNTKIGEVLVSVEDGRVVKSDLHIGSVD
jgi:hypothetical protein